MAVVLLGHEWYWYSVLLDFNYKLKVKTDKSGGKLRKSHVDVVNAYCGAQ